MIWYDRLVAIPETPIGCTVRLYGLYNPPEDQSHDSVIELKVEISTGPENTATIFTIYSHNPRALSHQETPLAQDIFARYNNKVLKAKGRLQATVFNDLAKVKPVL